MGERRLVRVLVAREWITYLMKEGTAFTRLSAKKGLPKDAVFTHAYQDNDRGDVYYVFQHESFEPVPVGDEIPVFIPEFEVGNGIAQIRQEVIGPLREEADD